MAIVEHWSKNWLKSWGLCDVWKLTQNSSKHQHRFRVCHVKGLLWALLWRRGLHWAYCKHSHAAIITHEKESLFFALSLIFVGQGRRCFWSLLCHNQKVRCKKLISSSFNLYSITLRAIGVARGPMPLQIILGHTP